MKLNRICSVVMAFSLAVVPISVTQAFAAGDAAESLTEYDTTKSAESKESAEIVTTTTTVSSSQTTVSSTISTTVSTSSVSETTTETPFNVFDIYNAHQGFITSTTTKPTEPVQVLEPELDPTKIYRETRGVDVSQWQNQVNWASVKASGVDFAIMRAGYGRYASQKDPTFDYNMQQAQAQGIQCGAYWYSYAKTVEEAVQEAEVCYSIIKDYNFTYPIYFDIEDETQVNLSTATVSAMVEAFCSTLEAKGYRTGVYSYANFLNTKIYSGVLQKYDVWVAHFNVERPSYSGEYGMWQYSSTGTVNGISGNVDMDVAYINYPYVISPETYVEPSETGSTGTIQPPTTVTTVPAGVVSKGIDVSVWQGEIDWKSVYETGVGYAIIRAGYGNLASQTDKYFKYNIESAKELGLDTGVYWYSYAKTAEEAIEEAKACCEVIEGYQLEYPVYFDLEDDSLSDLSAEQLTVIVDAFCSYVESKGYYVGIASYANFLNTKLDSSIYEKYDVWVAHYGVSKPSYSGKYGMWQYSATGTIDGIKGPVDLDYCYRNYPSVMTAYHLNGF